MTDIIKEACVQTFEEATRAEKEGADRIELCTALHVDGLTPPRLLIERLYETLSIPIRVMIRPRPGNFVYSEAEMTHMLESIDVCKNIGVDGVVFGILDENDHVDVEKTKALISYAYPMKSVFHKAVDHTAHVFESIDVLCKETDIHGVLTSGGLGEALNNIEVLKTCVGASPNIELIVCGRITRDNLPSIHEQIGAKSYHGKKIV